MRLPAPEATAESKVAFIDALEDECTRDPNRQAWDTNKQRWLDLYTGNHFAIPLGTPPDLEPEERSRRHIASATCKIVYNRVMNAVLAMLAGQVATPPRIVFNARESGEPPIYYLNGFVQHPIVQQMAMQIGSMDERVNDQAAIYGPDHPGVQESAMQAGQSVPLPPDMAKQLKAMIDMGKAQSQQAMMAGLPPPADVIPPEALVEITDQTAAQFTQTIFDALWEQADGIEAAGENILNKKVVGWQPTLFESDRENIAYGRSPVTLTNVDGATVFFDPQTSSYRPPRYVILHELVSVEEGQAKYPDIAEVLSRKARQGSLGGRRRNVSGRLFDLQYARDMCVVRTLWYRDWMYPMEPDEALSCGKISIETVETGELEQVPDPVAGTEIIRPAVRQTMVSTETGEQDLTPDHPSWPMIPAIREVRDIEGEVVFDQRCRLSDIPIVNNINIPIPFSPYGFGEPDRLDGLQMAINRILSDLVTNHRYNAYPPELRLQSVSDAIGGALSKARIQPNRGVSIPDELLEQLGGNIKNAAAYLDVPQMGADAWQLLEFLVEAIDKEANNSAVQQGEAPAGSSGEWVANLQAAASQVAQVTSKATESWLKKLVRHFFDFIAHDMTVEDIAKYSSKYPPAIIDAFKQKQKSLYLDISVEIQSGAAATKAAQTSNLIAARNSGIQISEPEIMERLGVDPDAQLKRSGEWVQKMRQNGLVEPDQKQQQEKKSETPKNGGG